MGCEVTQTAYKYIRDQGSCMLCREACMTREVRVDPGIYPRCMFMVSKEDCKLGDPLAPLLDLEQEFKRIEGVTICDSDYTDQPEGGICTLNIAKGPKLLIDPNCMCWPEGTTKEMIEAFFLHPNCCFKMARVLSCSELPADWLYCQNPKTKLLESVKKAA